VNFGSEFEGDTLQLEVNRTQPAEEALRAQVRELEQLVGDMKREMAPAL
jgi:hypothetical protein